MGKNSHKFKRGGKSNRGHNRRDFKKSANNSWNNREKQERNPSDRNKFHNIERISLKEDQVGITEYINPGKGFTGILKARFSDFHVNEIDKSGLILNLNDWSIPQSKDPEFLITSEELESAKNEISELISEDNWAQIGAIAKGNRTDPLEIEVTDLDKEKRTTIHRVIKRLYKTECNSQTVSKDEDKKFIRIGPPNKSFNRKTWNHPGEYVHFLVYKENMDTYEVAAILAHQLNLKPSEVNYCGTKDKRGKTTQRFCIKKRNPSQIVGAIKRVPSVKIGNFSFHDSVLKLGELKGNRFRIALRHVDGDRNEIEKRLKSIKEYGFINYYGLQRFGNNAEIPTYQIGIALLKSDYKTACELILKPRTNDIPFMRSIRESWWQERNSAKAAEMFHNDKFIEKKLLNGLAEFGENDYANALRKIPRNMLLMYTHAYQSWIFNRIASKRIKDYGLKLIVGDLVYRDQNEIDEQSLDAENVPSEMEEDANGNDDENKKDEHESVFKLKVKPLTEEDIASGKYTIFDVVLPIPGHDITYPANEVAQWYEDFLAEDDLSSEKLKHNVKTYSLAGAYRKILIQPQNMTWYFKSYNSPEEDIIPSHFEKENDNTAETKNEGQFTALVLDLCLPASVYATMFLREILKSDTSATNQAEMNQSAMKKFEEKKSMETKIDESSKLEEEEKIQDTTLEVSQDLPNVNIKTVIKRTNESLGDETEIKKPKQDLE